MAKAQVYITVSDSVRSFMQEAQAVGTIVKTTDEFYIVEIENDDPFQLGMEVAEFRDAVYSIGDYTMSVSKFEVTE